MVLVTLLVTKSAPCPTAAVAWKCNKVAKNISLSRLFFCNTSAIASQAPAWKASVAAICQPLDGGVHFLHKDYR